MSVQTMSYAMNDTEEEDMMAQAKMLSSRNEEDMMAQAKMLSSRNEEEMMNLAIRLSLASLKEKPRGLSNRGNTCYLASIIQALKGVKGLFNNKSLDEYMTEVLSKTNLIVGETEDPLVALEQMIKAGIVPKHKFLHGGYLYWNQENAADGVYYHYSLLPDILISEQDLSSSIDTYGSANGRRQVYKLVSTIIGHGSVVDGQHKSAGHYSTCAIRNNSMYHLNDSSVSPINSLHQEKVRFWIYEKK